jgi:hypothetical protein
MSDFVYRVTLIDTKALKTSLSFALSDTVYADAVTAIGLFATALGLVTDANIYSEHLIEVISGGVALPADADITDEALVVTYLSGAAEVPKYWNLRIPAPVDGLFNADGVTVDITDTDLVDLVLNIATNCFVSDGEVVDVSVDDGISHGFWRSVKKSTA